MNTPFDNFVRGPLTSLLGIAAMGYAGYAWAVDLLTDWQAGGLAVSGFMLLFMRDKIPVFISAFVRSAISKFNSNFKQRKK